MTRARSDGPRAHASTASDADDPLAVSIEEYADTVECTFFPYDATDEELVTTWITAADDAFVDVENYR